MSHVTSIQQQYEAAIKGKALPKFRPLHDRILVLPIETESVTKGGIFIPDVAKEKPQMGWVLRCGKGAVDQSGALIEMTVKEGEKIMYGKYSGTEITVHDEKYVVMRETDMYGVIDE